jgi:hypothetical protein
MPIFVRWAMPRLTKRKLTNLLNLGNFSKKKLIFFLILGWYLANSQVVFYLKRINPRCGRHCHISILIEP